MVLLLGTVGCQKGSTPQPILEPKLATVPAPFASLPPLHRFVTPPDPAFPPGPAPPRSIARQHPPLTPRRTASDHRPGKRVVVTAHPPLAGNPRGAVAFVFDQAMVNARHPTSTSALTLLITPPTRGRLRWEGDRTLVFLPRRRLRYATQYTFRLRPPLTARSGAQLTREVSTGFTTTAPALVESTPEAGAREVDVQPELRLRFNQPLDPSAALRLRMIRLIGPGASGLTIASTAKARGRHEIWLRPTKPLRPSTDYQLVVPAGLRGAEGTLGSLAASRVHFTTAGPLRLRAARCRQVACRPGDAVVLVTAGSPGPVCALLRLTPPVNDLRCRVRAGQVVLTGAFRSDTRYEIRLVPDDGASAEPPLTVAFGPRRAPLAFFPNRPLLTSWTGAAVLPVSGARRGQLRVAPVEPTMVSTLLTAIADPDALPPFQLTRSPAKTLPRNGAGSGFDLRSLGPGPALLLAALEGATPAGGRTTARRRTALLQRTGLSLVARYGWNAGVALVARSGDGLGSPRTRLRIRDRAGRTLWQGRSDAQGLAHFPGRRRLRRAGPFTLWAERGGDRTFLVLDGGGEDDIRTPGYLRGQRLPATERVIGAVFSDRRYYAPGDPVRLFGVLRGQTRLPRGGIGHLSASYSRVAYRVVSETEEEIVAGHADLGPAGLFRIDFPLSSSVQPGRYTAWLHLPGSRRAYADWVLGTFWVVPRRRRLRLTLTSPKNALMHRPPKLTISLREPSGRPATGATVRWRLYRQGDAPPPPGQPDFHFGPAQGPSISPTPGDSVEGPAWPESAVWVAGGVGTTDGRGRLWLRPRLTAPPTTTGATFEIVAEATTLDGRTVRRTRTLAARRQRLQLGLRPASRLARVGKPLTVWLLSVDNEGRPLPTGEVTVTAHRYDGPHAGVQVHSGCRANLGLATGRCAVTLRQPGRYMLRALPKVTDPKGSASPAEVVIYAHGSTRAPVKAPGKPAGQAPPRPAPAVEIIPGQAWYPEGAKAQLLLRSPVSPATALVTLERDGIAHAQVVRLKGPNTPLSVSLGQGLAPNAWVGVSVLGPHRSPPLPFATMSERVRLAIRPSGGQLRVSLRTERHQTLPDTQLPGAQLRVRLHVTDGRDRPVPAAVLLMLQPDTQDPAPDFAGSLQRDRGPGIALRATSAHRAAGRPRWRDEPAPPRKEPPTAGTADPSGEPDRPVQEPATSTAKGLFFRGPVLTDEEGKLTLTVPLPRTHGRYRLVALAADRQLLHRLGRDILPLTVKPAVGLTLTHPQTLRIGDRVSVVAHVQNHTSRRLGVTVLARSDQLPITSRVRYLHLAPGARGRATFAARATRVGLARLQVAAVAEGHSAALERRITVQPSAQDHTVRRIGVLRSTAALPLHHTGVDRPAPRHALWLSGSPLGVGIAALRWLLLQEVPTLEAAAARLLALSIVHRHRRTALAMHLPDASARRILCRRAMRQIIDLELRRGGLRRYDGGPPAKATGLAFGLLALSRARTSGCRPPGPLITALTNRLQAIASDPGAEPADRAFALAALGRHRGFVDPRLVTAVMTHWPKLPLVVRGHLLPLLRLRPSAPNHARHQRLRAALHQQLSTELKKPTPGPARPDLAELTALRLVASLRTKPKLNAVRTWVHQLLALGRPGRWGSARATSWALLALSRAEPYLAKRRGAQRVRAWLDDRHWGGGALRSGSLDLIRLSTGRRVDLNPRRLVLQTVEAGPTYFLVTRVVRQAPRTLTQATASLSVQLTPAGGRATPAPGKPLGLRLGANAIGRVTIVTTRSIPATVLRVPIPAGCDVVDPGHPRLEKGRHHRFPPPPILDATVRDGVLELHLADLPPGIHEHRLVIQTTSAGRFGCAPATLHRSTDERLLARAARCRPLRVREK